MTRRVRLASTSVPIAGGQDVTIEVGSPWPSAYRGSKYSLVESRRRSRDQIVQWKYRDLSAQADPPAGLIEAMQEAGKSFATGKGSFRVTSGGEGLTKIHAEAYPRANEAPHNDGWIPVYVGRLDGGIGLDKLNSDPTDREAPAIWDGLPFNHGETWAVGVNDRLIWKHEGFRFESCFEHPELVEAYEEYRSTTGRLYINEFGHVWVNVPANKVSEDRRQRVLHLYNGWHEQAKAADDTAALRLVARRLKVISPDRDPMNGHIPLYIGHSSEFDEGVLPRPVVTDNSYFMDCSRRNASA